jgi:hypothetical protein
MDRLLNIAQGNSELEHEVKISSKFYDPLLMSDKL